MWRALVFVGLLAIGASAAVWLADRPGEVVMTWGGAEYRTTVAVAAVLVIGLAMLLGFLWALVNYLMRLPSRMGYASRARRRAKGYAAVSRGMVAVGSGDPAAARRHAGEAERLLGREPLTLLLKAQAAQISGDRPGAEAAFRRMVDQDETRVLGLRGLFVEARRRGEVEAARAYAQEAARLAPAVGWANEAVLEAQSAEGDWRGALTTVERRASLGLLDKPTTRRHRAVLLTADALARQDRDPDGALQAALEATKLAPDLVPAAALAGRLLSRQADLRRAARVVEAAWKVQPHPELAEGYVNRRPGDSALDRLHRAENLARLSAWHPEARLAIARAALEAREFQRAREVLRPLLEESSTVRACLLMADIEQAEHGSSGAVREWLARAARAPRDPVWMADGVASERWAPVSPVTGQIDAFRWQAPPDLLPAPSAHHLVDDVVGDLDEPGPAIALPRHEHADEILPPENREEPRIVVSEPMAAPHSEPEKPQLAAATVPASATLAAGDPVAAGQDETTAPDKAGAPSQTNPVVLPLPSASEASTTEAVEERPRKRLFG